MLLHQYLLPPIPIKTECACFALESGPNQVGSPARSWPRRCRSEHRVSLVIEIRCHSAILESEYSIPFIARFFHGGRSKISSSFVGDASESKVPRAFPYDTQGSRMSSATVALFGLGKWVNHARDRPSCSWDSTVSSRTVLLDRILEASLCTRLQNAMALGEEQIRSREPEMSVGTANPNNVTQDARVTLTRRPLSRRNYIHLRPDTGCTAHGGLWICVFKWGKLSEQGQTERASDP